MKEKYKEAVLDQDSILMSFKDIKIDSNDQKEIIKHLQEIGFYIHKQKIIVPDECNLPYPNKYRWTGKEFMALGFGHPRPARNTNGVTKDIAFYHGMKALIILCGKMESPIAQECTDYINYFEANLKKRFDEEVKKGKRF